MSLLIEPGFGLRVNGISDSVLVPVNSKQIHGTQDEGRQVYLALSRLLLSKHGLYLILVALSLNKKMS